MEGVHLVLHWESMLNECLGNLSCGCCAKKILRTHVVDLRLSNVPISRHWRMELLDPNMTRWLFIQILK